MDFAGNKNLAYQLSFRNYLSVLVNLSVNLSVSVNFPTKKPLTDMWIILIFSFGNSKNSVKNQCLNLFKNQ